jgi:predicted glycosyltransferase involved in capsule biosynthesis
MKKKLCIVVPYRDRAEHLSHFAPHIEKTMKEQGIEYQLLIIEQTFSKPFNRAKLLNIGFDYTKGDYDYYCFHDVDMLPVESDYSYCPNPTHLATRAEQFNWKLPYDGYFGGVTIFDRESFMKINGYANEYWGWGAEDDDVFHRCRYKGIQMSRKDCSFRSLDHKRVIDQEMYHKNIDKLKSFGDSVKDGEFIEGLSTLKYKVIDTYEKDNYKVIEVEI